MKQIEIEKALYGMLKNSDIDKTHNKVFLENLAKNTAKYMLSRIQQESELPKDVFIDCSSPKEADICIYIGYNEFSSTFFYVGNVRSDDDKAFEKVIKYM